MQNNEIKQAINDEIMHFDKSYKDLLDVQYLKHVRYYSDNYTIVDINNCNDLLCTPLLKHYLLMKNLNRSLQKL